MSNSLRRKVFRFPLFAQRIAADAQRWTPPGMVYHMRHAVSEPRRVHVRHLVLMFDRSGRLLSMFRQNRRPARATDRQVDQTRGFEKEERRINLGFLGLNSVKSALFALTFWLLWTKLFPFLS